MDAHRDGSFHTYFPIVALPFGSIEGKLTHYKPLKSPRYPCRHPCNSPHEPCIWILVEWEVCGACKKGDVCVDFHLGCYTFESPILFRHLAAEEVVRVRVVVGAVPADRFFEEH